MKWKEEKRTILNDCGIFTVNRSHRKSETGGEADFVVLDTPDWVNVVVPLKDKTANDAFLMVRQFRHGSMEVTCEFPAGAIDSGETPLEAAARELREETGYEAQTLKEIGSVCPNPAFMNNRVYTVLAENAVLRHEKEFDEHEYVETDIISCSEVERLMGSGEYDNGVMIMALYFYQKYMERKK